MVHQWFDTSKQTMTTQCSHHQGPLNVAGGSHGTSLGGSAGPPHPYASLLVLMTKTTICEDWREGGGRTGEEKSTPRSERHRN